ncbi:MAG: ribonuclease P [Candidatus Thorarchaeota archaeon]|nr:ribonuclease P [Candidatus Thorarchaeota archaeon]
MSKRRYAKEKMHRLAKARIEILWENALREVELHPNTAREQMLNARKIAQRARIKVPREISRRICRECGSILIPGDTCRIRIRHNRAKHVVVTCLKCGKIKRFYVHAPRSEA